MEDVTVGVRVGGGGGGAIVPAQSNQMVSIIKSLTPAVIKAECEGGCTCRLGIAQTIGSRMTSVVVYFTTSIPKLLHDSVCETEYRCRAVTRPIRGASSRRTSPTTCGVAACS